MTEKDATTGMDLERIERMAQSRYTDLMSQGGVSAGRMAQELLFFLPKDFVQAYSEIFYEAFAGKDDGGAGDRGRMDAEKTALGKASGKGLAGLGGAKRKTYKKYWVIANDDAVRVKGLADKRLRVIARDMRQAIEDSKNSETGRGGLHEAARNTCANCRRFYNMSWRFCSYCGHPITRDEG